jgi:hypothetical protein
MILRDEHRGRSYRPFSNPFGFALRLGAEAVGAQFNGGGV